MLRLHPQMVKTMRCSVLICTYNRPDLLQQALIALIDKTIEKPDQVVIVNGGGTQTDHLVVTFANHYDIDVQLVNTTNKNLAISRNLGLAYCTGDIIAMTDDDAEVFPDWIVRMKATHVVHPEAGAVGGSVIGADSANNFLSRLADLVTFNSPSQPSYVRTLPGVNVSYKRDVVVQVGPQDENLFRGEDVDYNWRVKQLGYEIFYDPTIKVIHHHRPNLRQFLRQHYMYGRAYYLVRQKWPDMYAVYPREIRRPHDVLKAGYFIMSILIQPILTAQQLPSWSDRILAVPVLMANQIAWKVGMLQQKLMSWATKRGGS